MSRFSRQDALDDCARGNPRTRKTTVRILEGKADQDGAAFIQEQMSYVAPDLTVRQLDVISSRCCSAGHLQDQQTRLTAVCERCGAITCATPGCSYTCARCGRALCRRDAHVYGGNEAYCGGCQVWALLRRAILGRK